MLHIRGQAILEVPGRAVAHAVAVDRELLVQHDLQMTGQPWPQALCCLGREVAQVEIPGGPLVVARADRLVESHERSARRAPVQVVNGNVRRLRWRLTTQLVPLCPNSLLMVRLPPGRAQGEPEQQPHGEPQDESLHGTSPTSGVRGAVGVRQRSRRSGHRRSCACAAMGAARSPSFANRPSRGLRPRAPWGAPIPLLRRLSSTSQSRCATPCYGLRAARVPVRPASPTSRLFFFHVAAVVNPLTYFSHSIAFTLDHASMVRQFIYFFLDIR